MLERETRNFALERSVPSEGIVLKQRIGLVLHLVDTVRSLLPVIIGI